MSDPSAATEAAAAAASTVPLGPVAVPSTWLPWLLPGLVGLALGGGAGTGLGLGLGEPQVREVVAAELREHEQREAAARTAELRSHEEREAAARAAQEERLRVVIQAAILDERARQ